MKYYITCVQKRVSPYGIYEDEERLRELVVCKDCVAWDEEEQHGCTHDMGANDFCSKAERKEE